MSEKGTTFEWDIAKDQANLLKHGIPFSLAQRAFLDPNRIIAQDLEHSRLELRYFCFGKVDDGIITVLFTWREGCIRIFGAEYWRKGREIYEKAN